MITVLTGNFGSGKTEISVNLAIKNRGTLIDLDIVNPYFRSRRVKQEMEDKGVKVILPPPYLANSDLPVITPEVLGELQKPDADVVIDVGGDNVGAVVLGRFSKILKEKNAEIFLVINPYRPYTKDQLGVKQILEQIQEAGRVSVTGIISNPNLGRATTISDVILGHLEVVEIAMGLNLPIKFISCCNNLACEVVYHVNVPVMGIDIYMLTPWEL
ncbi:MAG: hypothetical protein VR72_05370 [Clostridiaceae bacterium BRH_c20a]|nr:MAG: hypothetical protein VR72_05370 [Clostridiaceae bacterium BRH_c20a]